MHVKQVQLIVVLSALALGGGIAARAQTSGAPAAPPASPAQTTPAAATPADAAAAQVAAQVAASGTRVHGTITDPDGELIPGATVILTPKSGTGKTTKSGSDGTYTLTVTPGTYTVVVSMPGFASYSALNVKIPAVASTTLDAKLQVGVADQVVNVDADSVQLSVDPDSNQSATVLTGKDLDSLSDDPDELSSELSALAGPSAGPNGGQIYVDGFTGGQLPPKSSIREIRINQNPFSAQYDQLGYGRVEVFTKPGTDKLHGNLQVNGNPSQLNSANPLETGYQPPYHTLFLFGNLTGPLNKNASYNLGGSFRQIQDDQFTNATIFALPTSPTTLCQPPNTTGCVSTPYTVQTYYPQVRGDFNPRLDLALGSKNVLTTRYQFVKNNSTNAGIGNLGLPTAGYDSSTTSNILQMSDTQTFSTRLINETRFEYEREHVQTTALSNAPTLSVSGAFSGGGYGNQNLSDHQDHYEVQNYTSLQLKKNFIRFGGRLRTTREAQNTGENTNGSFTYCGLLTTATCTNSYASGAPSQFQITKVNNHDIGDTYADLGVYLETDWKARQNLTVSYGFRYETQNHISDHHDIAPRVSVNYGLFNGGGKSAPKVVLRGGFGMFYTRFSQGNILNLEQENGVNETVNTVKNPGAGCNPGNISNCATTPSTLSTYAEAPNLRSPYIVQFAGGADKSLGRFGSLSVNYLHSQGDHQLATQNIGYNFTNPALTTPNYQYFTEGVFKQNQLIVNSRIQTSKRISLFGFYSLSFAHGDTSGGAISTPGNIAADYGRTAFDVRSRFLIAGSITLPHYILVAPFVNGQSGNPYNVTTGTDYYQDTFYNERPVFAAPNGIPAGTQGTNTIAGCGSFAAPAATTAAPGTVATIPINYCTGPALFTFNVRVSKTIGFGGNRVSDNSRQSGQNGPGGGGPPPGGAPGGGGSRGGGSRGGGGGGPQAFGGGGGASTGKRYNLTFGVQAQNLFNNLDLATPQGSLASPKFGVSTQVAGGQYTTESALRRISLQASFTF